MRATQVTLPARPATNGALDGGYTFQYDRVYQNDAAALFPEMAVGVLERWFQVRGSKLRAFYQRRATKDREAYTWEHTCFLSMFAIQGGCIEAMMFVII